jgi:putative Mg2+ transporter-C (MgtC) family protein
MKSRGMTTRIVGGAVVVSEAEALVRIVIAAGLGAALGIQREMSDKPAGLRTHMLVAEGAALFMVGSILLTQNSLTADPTRVASTIVSGIGFLGGGAIIQTRDRVRGITTAAGIWVAAAIGLLAGAGFYIVAIGGTVIALVTLALLSPPEYWFDQRRRQHARNRNNDQDQSPPSATE